MQFRLTESQQVVLHNWLRDLTAEEKLALVGYYCMGMTARDVAKGMKTYPMRVKRLADKGAEKAHIYIKPDKIGSYRKGITSEQENTRSDKGNEQERYYILEQDKKVRNADL